MTRTVISKPIYQFALFLCIQSRYSIYVVGRAASAFAQPAPTSQYRSTIVSGAALWQLVKCQAGPSMRTSAGRLCGQATAGAFGQAAGAWRV